MDEHIIYLDDITTYETPRVLATFEAGEILAQAETGSVVIIVS
jgi:hypothetical protein